MTKGICNNHWSVMSKGAVTNRIRRWNSVLADLNGSAVAQTFKFDVDGFFNNVSRSKIFECVTWLQNAWTEKFGLRRDQIVVPRKSWSVPQGASMSSLLRRNGFVPL